MISLDLYVDVMSAKAIICSAHCDLAQSTALESGSRFDAQHGFAATSRSADFRSPVSPVASVHVIGSAIAMGSSHSGTASGKPDAVSRRNGAGAADAFWILRRGCLRTLISGYLKVSIRS